ncbi:hypothetical protein GCM10027259_26900 [Micromonospora palomenae]
MRSGLKWTCGRYGSSLVAVDAPAAPGTSATRVAAATASHRRILIPSSVRPERPAPAAGAGPPVAEIVWLTDIDVKSYARVTPRLGKTVHPPIDIPVVLTRNCADIVVISPPVPPGVIEENT